MKKLLTTMLAVAAAMSLSAAALSSPTGTSFEGLTAGDYDITATTGELAGGSSYWETNETATLTVKAYQQGEQVPDGQGVARPEVYENASQLNYLSVKTTLGHPVLRYVNADRSVADMTGGLYFDSFVKFTAFDGDQIVDMSGNKKLAIWLKADEDSATPSTNLVITAGYLTGAQDVVVPTNYNCTITGSVNVNDGGWHRVTVKAMPSIYSGDAVPGFVVFVDGEKVCSGADKGINGSSLTANAAAFNAEGSLFPSACQSGGLETKATLTAVKFDGQGDVDDLVFTATAPTFAVDAEFVTINLGANVTGVTYERNTETPQAITERTDVQYADHNGQGYMTIGFSNYIFADGYMFDSVITNGAVSTSDVTDPMASYTVTGSGSLTITAKLADVLVNGVGYASLADAITAVNGKTDAGTYTVQLAADATGDFVIDNANADVEIVLDLAGKTITGTGLGDGTIYVTAGMLTITNSTETVGKVDGGGAAAVNYDDTNNSFKKIAIQAGDYDGAVFAMEISGGRFLASANQKANLDAVIVDGYAAKQVGNYYVLAELVQVAENPWYENPEAVMLAENLPEQTGNYVSAFHGQGSGSYLGLTYSTNPLQFDLFGVDGTNAIETITSVKVADVTNPGFRGVAISEALGKVMTLAYATSTTMYTFPLEPVVGGFGQQAVTKPSTHSFDSAAFSPDGNYLFSNALNGEPSNQFYVKWTVSADENTGALALTKVASISSGGRGRSMAYARINGRDLVFGLVDTGKVVVMDMTGNVAVNWSACDLVTDLPEVSYGSLCVSGVDAVDANGNPAIPHLTVATSINNGATKIDVLNVYALTVPASGAVTASLVKSFNEDALTKAGFGDISDANRYGNTVYVTDDESTIYFARPDAKLYAAQWAPVSWRTYLGPAVDGAFTIDDAADLVALKDGVAAGLETAGVTFKQTANINMINEPAFAGIGTYADNPTAGVAFAGTYDGQNYEISNVTFTDRDYAGIFNQVNGGTIQNLRVTNLTFVGTGSKYCASIIGNAGNGATLKNLVSAGSFGSAEKPGNHNMAGIAIRLSAGGSGTLVQNCTNNAAIYGTYTKLAGICALTQVKVSGGAVTFDGCANNGALTMPSGSTAGRDGLAGIVAYASDATVLVNCSNTGAITSTLASAKIGELVGYSYAGYTLTDQGGNSGDATKKLVNTQDGTINGFKYATVDNGVATTVTTLEAGNTYLLEGNIAASETPVITLAAANDYITFDTALGYTFGGTIGSDESLVVTAVAAGTEVTYTAAVAVARIEGGAKYALLKEAVDAAAAGDTVTVLADCTVATPVSFTKDITLHCDYTIGANVDYALCLGATVTFEGTGKIQRGGSITGSAFCVGANETTRGAITAGTAGTLVFDGLTVCGGSGGNLIKLENGSVVMNGGVLKDGLRGIKADADAGSYTSAIVINGGTITNCSAYAVFASAESAAGTATITINGGEIAGVIGKAGKTGTEVITIPGTSTAKFNRDQSALCETGYETTLSDGWYVVTVKQFRVTFLHGEGSSTYQQMYAYGLVPEPPTPSEVDYKTFDHWDPVIEPVVSNTAYWARYEYTRYSITYLNGDGTEFTNFTAGVQILASYTYEDEVTLPSGGAIDMGGIVGVQFAGWTNSEGQVVAGWPAGGLSGNQTFYAKLEAVTPQLPTYLEGADADVIANYEAWKTTYGADTESAYEKQFLLNVAPATEVPDAALKITDIAQNATAGWDITIECSVDGVSLTGTVGTAKVCNGYLAVSYTDDLNGTWTTENIDIASVADGKVTVTVNKPNASFMKVKLSVKAEEAVIQ